MAAEFVTFTDYYTGAPVAVRTAYIVTVAVRASATQIELDGDHDAVMVRESVAAVVARLNGEEIEAQASLIAAAPELLAALRNCWRRSRVSGASSAASGSKRQKGVASRARFACPLSPPSPKRRAAPMAAKFVVLTEYYTRLPVAARADRVVVVGQVNGIARLELDGVEDDIAVIEPFAVVVARLNGEDLTDGR